MFVRRESDLVVLELRSGHLQTVTIILCGAIVGLVLFFVVKPFAPDLGVRSTSDSANDSVSWYEAPYFDVESAGRPFLGSGASLVTICIRPLRI